MGAGSAYRGSRSRALNAEPTAYKGCWSWSQAFLSRLQREGEGHDRLGLAVRKPFPRNGDEQ